MKIFSLVFTLYPLFFFMAGAFNAGRYKEKSEQIYLDAAKAKEHKMACGLNIIFSVFWGVVFLGMIYFGVVK